MAAAIPCVLTIGGLDPSGGAGLPADARAVGAMGGHACGVVTAVIAQNTRGVARVEPVAAGMLLAQLENLLEDITPNAVKIGMVPHLAAAEVVARVVEQLVATRDVPVVIDTVFAPSAGAAFSDQATVRFIGERLLPLADFITPNVLEARQLGGLAINDRDSMRAAAIALWERYGARHVLLKGGHLPGAALHDPVGERGGVSAARLDRPQATIAGPYGLISAGATPEIVCDALDVYYDGSRLVELRAPMVIGYEVRGTGCLLASALATLRARGVPPLDAAWRAKTWLAGKIAGAKAIGLGRRLAI